MKFKRPGGVDEHDVDLKPNARARPDIKGRSASTSGRGHLDGGHPQRDAPGAAWVRRGDQEDRHAPATEGTHANWRVMAVASSSAPGRPSLPRSSAPSWPPGT